MTTGVWQNPRILHNPGCPVHTMAIMEPGNEVPPAESHPKFRHDIAVLRAVAIIAVFGFHFLPEWFPHCFLGVDIFFVISGYLIMHILSKDQSRPLRRITNFYVRRVKRIVPLAYLVLGIAAIAIYFLYTIAYRLQHLSYLGSTLVMGLNIELNHDEQNYFGDKVVFLPILHYWSLGVEMQFYLLAPLIFYASRVRVKGEDLGSLILLIVFVALYAKYKTDNPTEAFYNPLSRLWQFLAGMLASHLAIVYERPLNGFATDYAQNVNIGSAVIFISIFLIFIPLKIPGVSLIVTLVSAVFLFVGSFSKLNWSKLRLNYIAAISYSLYLVHYPAIYITTYYARHHELYVPAKLVAFLITIVISILLHHFFEKPLLRADFQIVLIVLTILFAAIGTLFYGIPRIESLQERAKSGNTTKEINAKAIAWHLANMQYYSRVNGKFVYQDPAVIGEMGHAVYQNGTGRTSLMLLGNSYAPQRASALEKAVPLAKRSTLDMFGTPGPVALFNELPEHSEYLWRLIEERKPDVVYVCLRYIATFGKYDEFSENGDDAKTKAYLAAIQRLSNFTKHIIVELDFPFRCEPRPGKPAVENIQNFLNDVIDSLERDKPLDGLNLSFNATEYEQNRARRRWRFVQKQCPKCQLFDLIPAFLDSEGHIFRMSDPATKHSYLDNQCHHTEAGLAVMEDPIRKVLAPYL